MRRELVEEEAPVGGPAVSRAPVKIIGAIAAVMLVGLVRAAWSAPSAADAEQVPRAQREVRPDDNGARLIAELAKEEEAKRAEAERIAARERAFAAAAAPIPPTVPLPPADDKLSVTEGDPPSVDALGASPADWQVPPLEGPMAATVAGGAPAAAQPSPAELARRQMQLNILQRRLAKREEAMFGGSLEIEGGDAPIARDTHGGEGLDESDDNSELDDFDGAGSQIAGLRRLTERVLNNSEGAMQARAGAGVSELGELGGLLRGGARNSPDELLATRDAKNLDFFRNGGKQLPPGVLPNTVQKARPYALLMGHVIPFVLETEINSELPGQIRGKVSENVYDTATGRHLLIPQHATIAGTYSGAISIGQERVQAAVVRVNFPNGDTLDLPGMAICDSAGAAGLRDQVDRHFWRRLGTALLGVSATIGYEATMPRNVFGVEGAAHRGLGEAVMQMITEMSRRNEQLPPSLLIRSGKRAAIQVSQDIVFPGRYEDGFAHRSRSRRGR